MHREPITRIVGRIQSELGVREAVPVDEYGPTSHLSEELLWAGYGLRRGGLR